MSIAEKIARAKADYDEVYEAGYAKGQAEGGDTTEAYNEALSAVWDEIQLHGTKTNYATAFKGWTNERVFRPVHDMNATGVAQMFEGAKITDLKGILEAQGVTLDCTDAINLYFFAVGSTITRFPAIVSPKTVNIQRAFHNTPVVSIDLLGVSTTTQCSFLQCFVGCTELVEIRFVAPFIPNELDMKSCKKLSHDSLMSLINALHPDTGGSITVSLAAVNSAFRSEDAWFDDGADTIEWHNLIATKNNWTINLV